MTQLFIIEENGIQMSIKPREVRRLPESGSLTDESLRWNKFSLSSNALKLARVNVISKTTLMNSATTETSINHRDNHHGAHQNGPSSKSIKKLLMVNARFSTGQLANKLQMWAAMKRHAHYFEYLTNIDDGMDNILYIDSINRRADRKYMRTEACPTIRHDLYWLERPKYCEQYFDNIGPPKFHLSPTKFLWPLYIAVSHESFFSRFSLHAHIKSYRAHH